MADYEIKPLTSRTWGAFAALVERNNGGGFGGCWCCYFHNATSAERRAAGGGDWRRYKERLVHDGNAHAALVFAGEQAVGWCQYGSPDELPGITHRKEVEYEGAPRVDYRLGCFFVDRRYRGKGVATAALGGALRLIAENGGGLVEAYPFDTTGKKVSSTFLYNATRSMCEDAGFEYERPKGKNHCIMRKLVKPN
jgi:GNAT superfamily N-acetyltransferase